MQQSLPGCLVHELDRFNPRKNVPIGIRQLILHLFLQVSSTAFPDIFPAGNQILPAGFRLMETVRSLTGKGHAVLPHRRWRINVAECDILLQKKGIPGIFQKMHVLQAAYHFPQLFFRRRLVQAIEVFVRHPAHIRLRPILEKGEKFLLHSFRKGQKLLSFFRGWLAGIRGADIVHDGHPGLKTKHPESGLDIVVKIGASHLGGNRARDFFRQVFFPFSRQNTVHSRKIAGIHGLCDHPEKAEVVLKLVPPDFRRRIPLPVTVVQTFQLLQHLVQMTGHHRLVKQAHIFLDGLCGPYMRRTFPPHADIFN